MDPIDKLLDQLSSKDRERFKKILYLIKEGKTTGMDLKKLQGSDQVYRVRKSSFRIIFQKLSDDSIKILAFERRGDTTYRNY